MTDKNINNNNNNYDQVLKELEEELSHFQSMRLEEIDQKGNGKSTINNYEKGDIMSHNRTQIWIYEDKLWEIDKHFFCSKEQEQEEIMRERNANENIREHSIFPEDKVFSHFTKDYIGKLVVKIIPLTRGVFKRPYKDLSFMNEIWTVIDVSNITNNNDNNNNNEERVCIKSMSEMYDPFRNEERVLKKEYLTGWILFNEMSLKQQYEYINLLLKQHPYDEKKIEYLNRLVK